MGNRIEHDPITGEPLMPTEDLSNVKLDPVLEYKLSQMEYETMHRNDPVSAPRPVVNPVTNAAPYAAVPPVPTSVSEADKARDNNSSDAKALCFVSLGLWILSKFVIFYWIKDSIESYHGTSGFGVLVLFFIVLPYIFVFFARKFFPNNRFARVLKNIYLIEGGIIVLLFFAILRWL